MKNETNNTNNTNNTVKEVKIQVRHAADGYYSKLWYAVAKIILNDNSYYRLRDFATTSTIEWSKKTQKDFVKQCTFEDIDFEKYVNNEDYRTQIVERYNENNNKLIDCWNENKNNIIGVFSNNIASKMW